MGSVHKFPRPPKNEQQFKGYRPAARTGSRGQPPGHWRLRDWQKSLLAWSVLVLMALAWWGLGKVL